MNTYIMFRSEGLKKFAYCIAPVVEVRGEDCYENSAVELVTDAGVEPFPLDWPPAGMMCSSAPSTT